MKRSVTSEGKVLWKIQSMRDKNDLSAPFTNIYKEDGKIYAYNWRGFHVSINLSTAEALDRKPGRLW